MDYTITSKQNKLIKMIKSLHQKKFRDGESKYFVEGIKIISEAIKQNIYLEDVIVCPEILNKVTGGKEINRKLVESGVRISYVPENIFNEICSTDTPQGLLAVISKRYNDLSSTFYKQEGFYIILDGIQDPGNLGTIIRTADAACADGVILSEGCADVYGPKTLRATMGSIFRVKIFENKNLPEVLTEMKNVGLKVIVSSLEADKNYFEQDFDGGVALVIGNEAHGITPEVKSKADCLIKIPMKQEMDSLNASVAAGILIYERYRKVVNY